MRKRKRALSLLDQLENHNGTQDSAKRKASHPNLASVTTMNDGFSENLKRNQNSREIQQQGYLQAPQFTMSRSKAIMLWAKERPASLLGPQTGPSGVGNNTGSIFEILGSKGDGRLSQLCSHCQHICDKWAKGVEDEAFHFPHYLDTFQLETSALEGCALCAQFIRSCSTDEIEAARHEMSQAGQNGYEAPGVRINSAKDYTSGTKMLSLKFLRPPTPDGDDDSGDDLDNEIIEFNAVLVPAISHGEQKITPFNKVEYQAYFYIKA